MVKKIDINLEIILEDIEGIEHDDNTQALLKRGIPAYVKSDGMPRGIMTKLYPDGRRETVRIDEQFQESVVSMM